MADFFEGGMIQLAMLFGGAVLLGAAIAYGVARAGRLRHSERRSLDAATDARQRQEDPQKTMR